jgi:mono/diheme cytochrome c family protein
MTRLAILCLILSATVLAQEPDPGGGPGRGGPGGRGGRGNRPGAMREFLGLGPAPDPAEAKKGEPLYKQNCAGCHGQNARGGQAPNLVRSVSVNHDEKDETIGPIIKQGRPGMPPFKLTDAEIHSISQYLKLQVELAANRGTYGQSYGDLRNKVTGDPKKGEAFFQANCTKCHSPTGDLAKIGGKFQQASQLQQRFLWPAEPGPAKATVIDPSGQKIAGTISREDDMFVSMRDESGQYRVWPKASVKVQVDDKLQGHRALLPKYSNDDIPNMTAYLVTLK